MTALQYMGTGIVFALVAGICFVGAIVYFLLTKQKHYLYAERLGRMKFPEQFYKDMKEQYEKTENISQTLDLLLEQYPKGKVAKRLRASKDYLKNSHYKDYETALYRYLSDSDTANVITELLLKDLRKICRIPCKQEKILERRIKMRRSNWKTKVIVVIAFILSIVLGVVAAMFAPDVWKGLVGFGTFAVVLLVLVFILVKVLHIGRE
ncbi:hypothetical protein DXB52_07715 [Ruminococcus sp. OM04-4AA]|uniref:hypothetical protein n=1 Tax=Mediterraneibacter faecis TaxID=592978 RepID=UPI000E489BAA|nr:hypothetical protein [Mediterraneibacter faecis]RGI48907.1 hypothetical protein DXB52_07715 [Ruminococcus sp. OM04-4AA]